MRAPLWAALYVTALAGACTGSGPEPAGPNPSATAEAPPPQPTVSCNHEKLDHVYLAATERVRQLVDDRRKVGIVPVKLSVDGCDVQLEVLEGCNMPGFYSYRPQAGRESKTIRNENDLFAEMPVGAGSMQHKLSGGQILRVDQTTVGVFSTSASPTQQFRKQDMEGDRCIEATHYISKIFVGGFAARQGSADELNKVSKQFGEDSSAVFTQEGEASACTSDPNKMMRFPHELCSVPLKIALSSFSKSSDPSDKKGECAHDLCEAGGALDAKCNTCAEAVCDQASYCCKSHWDGGCITKAKQLCKNPCSGCEHELCEQGVKLDPTCDPCVQKVCAADAFCCNNKWDSSCVSKVVSVCNQKCAGVNPTCTGGRTWNGSACVCPAGKTWSGTTCLTPASCDHDVCVSGGPLLSSCDSCTQKVCQADSYCCKNNWDSSCLKKVKDICKKTCPCDKYGTKGKCEGKTLKYCIGGKLQVRDCSTDPTRKYCGYNPKTQYASCQEKPSSPWGGGVKPQPSCKSDGNACTSNSQCCNKSCFGGKCQQPQ